MHATLSITTATSKTGDHGAEEAYYYGAGDDDAEDEYATVYDTDDQGAKVRRS